MSTSTLQSVNSSLTGIASMPELQDLDTTALSCLFLGLFVLTFSLWSRVLKETLYLSEPLLFTIFGILLSEKMVGIVLYVPERWDRPLSHSGARDALAWLCRIIIGVHVLFAASMLPSRWLGKRRNLQSMAMLLLPVMTIGWLVSSGLVKACFPSVLWTEALIIGACIAPTDPVLANSVVTGAFAERHVPLYVRQILLAESGLNDGFGTPFLFIPILAILNGFNAGGTIKAFVFQIVLYDVLYGSALGVGVGYIARKGLKVAQKGERIDRESMMVFTTALAIFTVGLGQALGTNGLLACFFAGTALNWADEMGPEGLYSPFSEGVEIVLDHTIFFVFGVILPMDTWIDPDFLPIPNLILLGIFILALRRLPAVVMMHKAIPVLRETQEAVFAGYFGPIGVSALYYALIATDQVPDDYAKRNTIIPTTMFIIFSSIVVHGISAPFYMLAKNIRFRILVASNPLEDHTPVRNERSETTPLLGATSE